MDGLGAIKLTQGFCGSVRFEMNGKMFFKQPITEARDHVWKSEAGDQLIFRGPSYEVVEYIEATTRGLLGGEEMKTPAPTEHAVAAGSSSAYPQRRW